MLNNAFLAKAAFVFVYAVVGAASEHATLLGYRTPGCGGDTNVEIPIVQINPVTGKDNFGCHRIATHTTIGGGRAAVRNVRIKDLNDIGSCQIRLYPNEEECVDSWTDDVDEDGSAHASNAKWRRQGMYWDRTHELYGQPQKKIDQMCDAVPFDKTHLDNYFRVVGCNDAEVD